MILYFVYPRLTVCSYNFVGKEEGVPLGMASHFDFHYDSRDATKVPCFNKSTQDDEFKKTKFFLAFWEFFNIPDLKRIQKHTKSTKNIVLLI